MRRFGRCSLLLTFSCCVSVVSQTQQRVLLAGFGGAETWGVGCSGAMFTGSRLECDCCLERCVSWLLHLLHLLLHLLLHMLLHLLLHCRSYQTACQVHTGAWVSIQHADICFCFCRSVLRHHSVAPACQMSQHSCFAHCCSGELAPITAHHILPTQQTSKCSCAPCAVCCSPFAYGLCLCCQATHFFQVLCLCSLPCF